MAKKKLTYKDDTHQYFLDGVEVPSVSKLVEFGCGFSLANISKDILDKARKYGTDVHNAIEKYETTGEFTEGYEAQVVQYMELKKKYLLDVDSMEQMVTDGENFGGRYDILDKEGTLWDIKTTSKTYPNYDDKWSWQLSFYYYGLGIKKNIAYIIYLPKKGKHKVIMVNTHPFEEVKALIEAYNEEHNGSKSIIQTKNECYICHCGGKLDTHHVCNGPFRDKSEHWGGVVKLCRECHMKVHNNPQLAKNLKAQFQANFELLYGRDKWMEVFKKNYV